ncbi:MAG TPA: rhomboid family protein [Verrucomicrobiae bacterium]
MQNLLHQRCFNHATREAVARCPECGRFFCRECITEHDDRVLCSACLKKLARTPLAKRPAFVKLFRLVQGLAGLMVAWFFFFLIGSALLKIPAPVHEGTVWHAHWLDKK